MKSIKEKAEEYSEEHGFRVPYDGSNNFYDEIDVRASEEGFEAGANYVLDAIEATNICFNEELKRVIEQLKSNQ